MSNRKTTKDAITELKNKFGDSIFYDKVDYINANTKIELICPKHGSFFKHLRAALKSKGCPKCMSEIQGINSRKTTEEFVREAIKVHGNTYDYSLVEYKTTQSKVNIICSKHGIFNQRPISHLRGNGCAKCGFEVVSFKLSKDTQKFIEQSKKVHGELYDYSKVDYVDSHTKVVVICDKHGPYNVLPHNHIRGVTCDKCAREQKASALVKPYSYFLERALAQHGYAYEYDESSYNGMSSSIIITCSEHGPFQQLATLHAIAGQGCSKCRSYRGVQTSLYESISSNISDDIEFDYSEVGWSYELDMYIPSKGIGIELDGLYWHSDKFKDKYYHRDKQTYFKREGIRVLHVFEDEWYDKREIVSSIIQNALGQINNVVYGRDTRVASISYADYEQFMVDNHIQGTAKASIRYGLYHGNELVSCMSFGKPRRALGKADKNGFELIRFANKINLRVIGSATKLYSTFVKEYAPTYVYSYANKRYFSGALYQVLGMDFVKETIPNYFYVKGAKRFNRFMFRKDILVSGGEDINSTEREIMKGRGYLRIYDCGTYKYEAFYANH